MNYKEALISNGYSLTDSCGCGGTPTETYTLNFNKFIIKPLKNTAFHYYDNKQIRAIMPPEVPKYLKTI